MGATTSSFGADLGLQVAGAVAQPLMEQGSYYLGKLTGYNDDIAKDQLEQQRKLAEQAQGIAFKGMDKSQELNKDMFDYTFAKQSNYNSAAEQVKRYKDAGLNPALMYNQGNAGMAGGTTGNTTAPQVSGGNASNESERRTNNIAAQGIALQLSRQAAEIDNIKADTKNKEANAENLGANTQTTNESRQILINKLAEEGKNVAIDRIIKEWKLTGATEFDGGTMFEIPINVNKDAYFGKMATEEILNIQAVTGNAKASAYLYNEKAKIVYQEMLNGIVHADADKARAAAQTLATDYQVGDYVNWKQILESGADAVGAVADVALKGAKRKITNTMQKKVK